mgnify:CR=1 FL=1
MTDVTDIDLDPAQEPAPKSKKPLLIGLVAALLMGGGGFYATYSGLVGGGGGEDGGHESAGDDGHGGGKDGSEAAAKILGNVAFVPLDPIMVSMPPGSPSRHLRFAGQLEVVPGKAEAVVAVMPRILDVLNTYLRAVEVSDLEEPASAARLRAQMLRRVQVVTGEGLVKDLLVTEFVMN